MMGLGELDLINEPALPLITLLMMIHNFVHHKLLWPALNPPSAQLWNSCSQWGTLISRGLSYSFNYSMNNTDSIQNWHWWAALDHFSMLSCCSIRPWWVVRKKIQIWFNLELQISRNIFILELPRMVCKDTWMWNLSQKYLINEKRKYRIFFGIGNL